MSTSTDHLTALDSPSERRFYPRSTPSRPIYIAFGGNNLCMLLNLSENGFLISTPAGLDRNSVYRVSIRLNGVPKPIEVPVRTIWTAESRERAGIQMLDLSDHDREQIRKWQALEGTREKPAETPLASVPAEALPRAENVAPQVSPPPVPVMPKPPRPPAPAIAAARAAAPLIMEPLKNTHLDALRSPSSVVARPRKKRSEAPALIAWILVGAVTCIGIALLMRPELFGRILLHAPNGATQAVETPANAPAPLKELEARSLTAAAKPAAVSAAPVDWVEKSASAPGPTANAREQRGADMSPSSEGSAAVRNHFSLTSSPRPNLNAVSTTPTTSTPANGADSSTAAGANSAPRESGSGTAPATPGSTTASNKMPSTAADSQLFNGAPAAVTTAPVTTPAPTVATPAAPITPAPSGKSAITGSIVDSVPRGNDVAAAPSAASPNASPSTWSSSGPVAAGRSSLLRSRSNSGSGVVHMDVTENRVMEITPPRGITSSYVNLPGDRVLELSGMTLHIRRAVRVPADRWIWHSRKQLVLGELSSRVDPQVAHAGPGYGSITVQAVIDKDGRVSDLKPLNGSSNFLPSVTRAVREWQYEPSYLDGKPVETRAEIEVDFHPGTNPRP
jgi:hypothetical protein